MTKQKKHLLEFDSEIDYDLIGICSHHNDYRLAWSINSNLGFHLEQTEVPFYITYQKKGIVVHQAHTMYEFYESENRVTYYLIKNKENGKFLIPEKPIIDYFVFIHKNNIINISKLMEQLRNVNSILAVFEFIPEDIPSTENIIF